MHHHQQPPPPPPQHHQLAALLAAALPKDDSNSTTSTTATATPATSTLPSGVSVSSDSKDENKNIDSPRLAAIDSLHRAILYPPNSLLVAHSASFLAQGFSRLLADKSYAVRVSAAGAYGALCAIVSSIPLGTNGRQTHVMLGSLVDRFISWALPLLNNVGTTELALESLREFLNAGDAGGIERYAFAILKSCQELLEDERTSLSLLQRLLGVLTLISLKFYSIFQPHFLDIVDLLLGWALVPDLADTDRRVIMDSFLQFQKHWVSNLQFPVGLLSKFLDDMDVLLQDGSQGTPQQFRRLLALLSCFCTVLQSTASGLLELNLLEQITEPFSKMVPKLLGSLSIVGQKFGWSKWIEDSWKCLTLLAEILRENFSTFYPLAVDILFQSLIAGKITSIQVHGVLKTNLQLLSLQKLGLLPSSVEKVIKFGSPISQLRLHPNYSVTGSSAATYIFLLQHGNHEIVEKAVDVLIEELGLLKNMLGYLVEGRNHTSYSKYEIFGLIKFDLKVLLTCISLGENNSLIGQSDISALYVMRSEKLASSIMERLNPFDLPVQAFVELQVDILKTLDRITAVVFLSKCSLKEHHSGNGQSSLVFECLKKHNLLIVKALHTSSPLSVKLVMLESVKRFCENLIAMNETTNEKLIFYDIIESAAGSVANLVFAVLNVAFDKEPKVRLLVVSVLELLLQARFVHPMNFYFLADIALERIGDADVDIRNAFVRLLSNILPTAVYACGLFNNEAFTTSRPSFPVVGRTSNLHWKQVFALKQLPQQLHSQQLVSILSYISQRWKVPLSSWVQRLIHSCRNSKDQHDEKGNFVVNDMWLDKVDEDVLDKICYVNDLAGAWWAIHEAARYCVSTRLRTNLGGPTQTFAALERTLLDVAHVLQLDSDQNGGGLSILGSSGAHLLPMRLLLDFVESLKKNVYNAYEGSVVLPPTTRQSSLFFRANRKVCEEWFSRICEPMMNAGLVLQCHDATIHYCALRLQELRNLVGSSENNNNLRTKYSGEILKVLRHMGLALCRSHDSEALIGLQKWVSMTFSALRLDFEWISGLVNQAKGEYEKAAAKFTHLLQLEESLNTMGSEGVQFVISCIIECYTSVSDWKSLENWLVELQELRSTHAGKNYSGALTTTGNEINAIHALACFDEGDHQAAWTYLDLTPKSSSELSLDPKLALQRSEQMLLQALLLLSEGKSDKVPHELHKAKLMLHETLSVLPLDGLAEAAAHAMQFHCIFTIEQVQEQKRSYVQSAQSIYKFHQDCNPWLKVFRVDRTIFPNSSVTLKLCINLLSLARKQGNLMLANRLNNYLEDHLPKCPEEKNRNLLVLNLQYERVLLLHAENNFVSALENIWSFVSPCLVRSTSVVSNTDESMLKTKACLKLVKWLKQDYLDFNLEAVVRSMQADFNQGYEILSSTPSLGLIIEEIVGTALKMSTHLCSAIGKAWISYATWCFTQAKDSLFTPNGNFLRLCSFSSLLAPEVLPNRFKLTDDERRRVESLIFPLFQTKDDERTELNSATMKILILQIVDIIETTAGAPGAENSSGECLSSTLVSQLRNFLQQKFVSRQAEISLVIDNLVDIWWSLRKRRVSLFGVAADSFIHYLSHSSSKHCNGLLFGLDNKPIEQNTCSNTLRAVLYVLHIILNYGTELKDTLSPALSTVPLFPWQEVTPQLFARLSSHPEPVIRRQLEEILMMLAKISPSSIVYPTLVDVNAYEEKPSEELQRILSYLVLRAQTDLYPRLIHDVQLMISELGNVTILWEELWLSTLQDLHADVLRRINVLREEAARMTDNVTLTQSEKNKINGVKYSAMMAPIVVALERRLASTSRKPETPHEIWFHNEYQEKLKSAILTFKTPPKSPAALVDIWRPFENLAASLASYQRKSSISLGEVAPQLALLSSSDVPMPGLEKQVLVSDSDTGVTISSFLEQVTILSTKTKPKKLVLLGSDGKEYTYLLKGREDLRLDARIMQLLQAINGFLQSSRDMCSYSLGIRYYTVTPITGQAGLIQWLDNLTSIYSLFKSWQNRVQVAQLSAMAGAGNTKSTVPPHIPRPSDMFYGKIIPALKEKGIRRVISRRDWPHDVKRKVLLDLMTEVPSDLLHKELWCASEGFKAFSSKLKRYSGSVAAMSMVGHMMGLGDRHLDNILVDFCNGDVVHIDYNVCFDKGQRLKVPEIVPFRLTQVMESALGLTGVEGTFRANCEAVLGILRKNKDIVLMLLEVFVWDPLVEWTRGDFHDDAAIGGEERKGMELAVSLSLFASRVQEIRVPLQEHHDLLLATLAAVESALEGFSDALNKYEIASSTFYRADQERSKHTLHETSAKSFVAEATCTSEKSRASFEIQARDFTQAKSIVAEKAQEAATWIEQRVSVLDALRCNLVPEINTRIKWSDMIDALSLTSAVLVAGVPLTIVPEPTQVQCHDIDREVGQLITELDQGLSSALNALQAYSLALQRILPLNYTTTSPLHGWAQILQLSANAISGDIFTIARRQGAELIGRTQGDNNIDSIKRHHDDLCLKVERYALEIEKVESECAELTNSIGSGTESKAKDRLMSAFAKYMQSVGVVTKKDVIGSNQLAVLNLSVSSMYDVVKCKLLDIVSDSSGRGNSNSLPSNFESTFSEFEEQVEKCVLVTDFMNEIDLPKCSSDARNHPSIFKASLLSCKSLVEQMTEEVLPDLMRSTVLSNSEVMDAFGLISQIRGSTDMALEQLLEMELERSSLVELEQNYFVRVGHITEKQLALQEAAMKGRDHLSWEEADELTSQEEACRAQLDQLHQTWNQRDIRTSSIIKREAEIKNILISSENKFQSLTNSDGLRESCVLRLLSMLVKPFDELEQLDKALSCPNWISNVADLINSGGQSISEHVWKFGSLLNCHTFFIWKIGVVDSILDSCIHYVSSSVDQNLGFYQLFNIVKKKLEIQIQEHIGRYFRERVTPAVFAWLDIQIEHLKQQTKTTNDFAAVRRVQLMLEEYCNTHETVRAARSAAFLLRKQVNELRENLCKTGLEIVQMEWLQDSKLNIAHYSRVTFIKFLSGDDDLHPIILNLSRSRLLESIRSAVSKIAGTVECLQASERNSVSVEDQLERAMGWACGGPSSNASGNSGIPPEFSDHLMRRQQLLWEAREKASDIVRLCISVLEFEASRDGIFHSLGDQMPSGGDARSSLQQAYLSALTKLEVTYHSYKRTEHEWKLAQTGMEAASNDLYSATNELYIVSQKAKSASGELQSIVLEMRDCAYEASVALSAFGRVSRSHTALTSESGSMLEEVLAITEDLHDVHNLGKEASTIHHSLIEELSKASSILLPLESMLSKDVGAMTEAMARETETKKEVSPIHGQAIYQSYSFIIREASQTFKPLVPSLTTSTRELYLLLTRLARTASLHAGNLHKALEGLGESQDVKSQGITLLKTDITNDETEFDDQGKESFSGSRHCDPIVLPDHSGLSLQDKDWMSPPDSIYSSSSESLPDGMNDISEEIEISHGYNVKEGLEYPIPSPQTGVNESDVGSSKSASYHLTGEAQSAPFDTSPPTEELDMKRECKDEISSFNNVNIELEKHEAPVPCAQTHHRVSRGKNAYAMSVLRRIEMKLEGRDSVDDREISISEQVEHLIKQATSVDNLCNIAKAPCLEDVTKFKHVAPRRFLKMTRALLCEKSLDVGHLKALFS
ncbi:hypothetical protein ACFE04_021661 [Oxalis oulophora]